MSQFKSKRIHVRNTFNVNKYDLELIFWKNITSLKLIPSYQNLYYSKQVIIWHKILPTFLKQVTIIDSQNWKKVPKIISTISQFSFCLPTKLGKAQIPGQYILSLDSYIRKIYSSGELKFPGGSDGKESACRFFLQRKTHI